MSTVRGAAAVVIGLLCGGAVALAAESYDLTFEGDATFGGAHGGQTIHAAVVQAESGEVVAEQNGTVAASGNPSFSLSFPGALMAGERYEVHYWIDSNFGGGSEGTCDPKSQDHQWRVELGEVSGDLTETESHSPGATEDVCDTFADM